MPLSLREHQKTKVNNLFLWFLIILLAYLPFQSLFVEILDNLLPLSPSLIFWLSHLYEPAVIIFFIVGLSRKISKGDFKFSAIQLVAFGLVILGAISIVLFSPSISRGVEGFRFSLFAIIIFLTVTFYHFSKDDFALLINIYIRLVAILALWAIVERFLPQGYWQYIFGAGSSFGYGAHKVINMPQSMAVFGGPNQLASYILPAIFIIIVKIADKISNNELQMSNGMSNIKSRIINNIPNIIFLLIMIVALILTFSRSALVALILTLIIYFIFFSRNRYQKWVGIPVVTIVPIILGLIFYFGTPQMKDMITHGASQLSHIEAMKHSIWEIGSRISRPIELFFGSGIGTAGPAALKYGRGFVSESWYFQLTLELGFAGLSLWLLLLYYLFYGLIKENQGLFLGLLSVSVAALFLHTWADNPAVALTLFALLGASVTANPKSESLNPK